MPYVDGPPPAGEVATPQGFINPRTDPEFYQDADNLGFSLARFKINKKSFTRPLATVKKNALVSAGIVASFIPIPGVGMLAPKLLGLVKGAGGALVNKVTGGSVQRVSTATIDKAGPQVSTTPSADSGSGGVIQRLSTATQIMDIAGQIKSAAGGAAGAVAKAADIAGAISAAATDLATGGDAAGAAQAAEIARQIAALASKGQATAENVAGVIQQGGAAVQGAAAGAIANVAADNAASGFGDFMKSTTGKVALAGVVVGGGWLLAKHDNGRGRGSSRHWD
jgi:hypothetical protein